MNALYQEFDTVDVSEGFEVDQNGRVETGNSGWFETRFENWSLAAKLRLVAFGVALIPFLVVAMLLLQFAYFGNAGAEHSQRVRAEVAVAEAALFMAQTAVHLDAVQDEQSAASLSAASASAAAARDQLAQAVEQGAGLYPESIIAQLREGRDHLAEKSAMIDRLTTASAPSEIAALRGDAWQCAQEFSELFYLTRNHAQATIESILQSIAAVFALCVGLALSAIAACVLSARVMIANIVGQITDITRAMEDVAGGDVEAPIPGRDRKDEIGAMAHSLTVFRSGMLKLRALTDARAQESEAQLAQQQALSEQLRELRSDKRKLLEGLADGFEVSVGDVITAVSTASTQLKATSRQMGDLADGSNGQAQSATDAMENATANVNAAAAATDQFSHSIGEISQQAAASAQLARSASELVTTANSKMTDLSNAALEIGEIAGMIQTIAQRTNLLALNASIEAARGGEAGRGFAVVASEVKELAMQTSNATRSVAEKITTMQDFTRSSAGDLSGIVDHIEELEQASVMIAAAVDEQSVSGEELARNIETVAAGSAQVAAQLGTLREASRETGSAADDVVSSANALGDHADNLRDKAGRFIADVRRSARDLEAREADLQKHSA